MLNWLWHMRADITECATRLQPPIKCMPQLQSFCSAVLLHVFTTLKSRMKVQVSHKTTIEPHDLVHYFKFKPVISLSMSVMQLYIHWKFVSWCMGARFFLAEILSMVTDAHHSLRWSVFNETPSIIWNLSIYSPTLNLQPFWYFKIKSNLYLHSWPYSVPRLEREWSCWRNFNNGLRKYPQPADDEMEDHRRLPRTSSWGDRIPVHSLAWPE